MIRLLTYLLIGAFIGGVAGRIYRGKGFGCLGNIIIAIIGSFIGYFIFGLLGFSSHTFISDILVSIAGSIIFLWLIKLIFR